MPWENNGGGGGRNNNGGPWGQAPGSGGGGPRRPGGGNTPNLEDILNRGRDRFRGGIPGGRWAIVGGVLALVAFWAINSIYTIDTGEVGVEMRFGAPKPDLSGAGLHFMLWPVDSVERVSVVQRQTNIGSSQSGEDGLMLSGDQNIVNVRFAVNWSVTDPIAYQFNVRKPEEMVLFAAESAMREVIGRRPAQDAFRDDLAGISIDVQSITQSILDEYRLGVTVDRINMENGAPPAEVADAFSDVQRAEQEEDRVQELARAEANKLLGDARGQAAARREAAAAYTNRVVQEATGEAQRFNAVYAEYVNSPEVTRKRMFLETMEQVLGGSEKVLIESGANGQGVIPYLPLPELRPGANSTKTGN